MIYENNDLYEALLGIEVEPKQIQTAFLNKLAKKHKLTNSIALEIMSGAQSQYAKHLTFKKVNTVDLLSGVDITNKDHLRKLDEYEIVYGLHGAAQSILYNGIPSYTGVKLAIQNLMEITPNLVLHICQDRALNKHYSDMATDEIIYEYEYINKSNGSFKGRHIKYDFAKEYTRHSGVSSLHYSNILIDGKKQNDITFDQLQLSGNSIKDICDELNYRSTFYYDSGRTTSFYEAANFVHIQRKPAIPRYINCYIDNKYNYLDINTFIEKLQKAKEISHLTNKSTLGKEWITDLQLACLNERYNRHLSFYANYTLLLNKTFINQRPYNCLLDNL